MNKKFLKKVKSIRTHVTRALDLMDELEDQSVGRDASQMISYLGALLGDANSVLHELQDLKPDISKDFHDIQKTRPPFNVKVKVLDHQNNEMIATARQSKSFGAGDYWEVDVDGHPIMSEPNRFNFWKEIEDGIPDNSQQPN